jgi:hypothetical protein
VHLVAEPGRAFGIRFRPAGFHPFLGAPVASLTDRRVAVAAVLGPDGDRLVGGLLAAAGEPELVATAEAFLLDRLPAPDPNVALVNRLHEAVERLDRGDHVDLGFLARDLGYFDQAHFARDFRAAVGRPPAAYARGSASPG